MTNGEKQKAIDALKISAPVRVMTQEEFNDYIQTLNKIMDWLEQEPIHRRCNQCKYYKGVHNVQGHAPCSYHNIGGVLWDWYCSQFESEVEV